MDSDRWIHGKPFIATAEDLKFSWGCGKNGSKFKCGLCGYKFKEGDTVRWQYTSDTDAYGNPFVCTKCDGTKEQICSRIREIRAQRKALEPLIH